MLSAPTACDKTNITQHFFDPKQSSRCLLEKVAMAANSLLCLKNPNTQQTKLQRWQPHAFLAPGKHNGQIRAMTAKNKFMLVVQATTSLVRRLQCCTQTATIPAADPLKPTKGLTKLVHDTVQEPHTNGTQPNHASSHARACNLAHTPLWWERLYQPRNTSKAGARSEHTPETALNRCTWKTRSLHRS